MRKVFGGLWREWGVEWLAIGIVPGLATAVAIIDAIF